MYFAAHSYELRYAAERLFLLTSFGSALNVTREMIEGDFNMNSPRPSGEIEIVTLKYPKVQGSQVSILNYSLT